MIINGRTGPFKRQGPHLAEVATMYLPGLPYVNVVMHLLLTAGWLVGKESVRIAIILSLCVFRYGRAELNQAMLVLCLSP